MKLRESDVADHYLTMQIDTASRQKQICMLHDKCVEHIIMACTKSGEDKRDRLDKAQNILSQFQAALRVKDNISQSLFYLYDYSYVLLEENNNQSCRRALEVMRVLRDTFRTLLLTI
jgi:flagellar biosynthetic protein FliS